MSAVPKPMNLVDQYTSMPTDNDVVIKITVDAVIDAPAVAQRPKAPPAPDWDDAASVAFMQERLRMSGLTHEEARAYPARHPASPKVPGFVLQYADSLGGWRMRLSRDENKYMGPKDYIGIWFPVGQSTAPLPENSQLYIIEGELKASKVKQRFPHLNVVGIGGAWMFQKSKMLHPVLSNFITFGTRVSVVFDGDVDTKLNIKSAAGKLLQVLSQRGCAVTVSKPPIGKGADDWLVSNPQATIKDLVAVDDTTIFGLRKLAEELGCSVTKKDVIIPNETNAKYLIQHIHSDGFRVDRRLGVFINDVAISEQAVLDDLLEIFQTRVNASFKPKVVAHGYGMALPEPTDFLQDLLRDTVWDGTKRLDTWGSKCIPTDTPALADDWGRQLMTALALRIMRPGCKCDTSFWLVGPQGYRKTMFLKEIAHFGDYDGYRVLRSLANGDRQNNAITMSDALITDVAEAQAIGNKLNLIEAFKDLCSEEVCTYRRPYATHNVSIPVGYVICGTSNRDDLIHDTTGARRFFPLHVTGMLKLLDYGEKLQILAEVMAMGIDKILAEAANPEGQPWWRCRVKLEDMPEKLRLANPHIKDAQMLNTQSYRGEDTFMKMLAELLENDHMPERLGEGQTQQSPRVFFFNTRLLALQTLGLDASEYDIDKQQRLYGKLLDGWLKNPAFPYLLDYGKVSLSTTTLDLKGWDETHLRKHSGGAKAKQAPQAWGHTLRHKPSA